MKIKIPICLILCLILTFMLGDTIEPTYAYEQNLQGPLLASRVVGGDWITFEDVGAHLTWQVKLPDSSFIPTVWSPDGCELLMRGSGRWAVASASNANVRETPRSLFISGSKPIMGEMIWSFDAKSLTATVYFKDDDVRIYAVNLDTFVVVPILVFNEWARAIKWLSETELLYEVANGDYLVWDTIAKKSRLYQHKLQVPSDWSTDLYLSQDSPNQEYLARYYSVNALQSFISASQEIPPPEDVSPEYVATLAAIPKVPGFDIYTFENDSTLHVNVMGQFLQFLTWSPSGSQLILTTDPYDTPEDMNGIYVYNLADKVLQRVGDFPAMVNSEYGGYEPTWSPDSNWLAFNTPTGYIIFSLVTHETIKLSDVFDGFYMSLHWSPVMDYSGTNC